MGDRVRQTTTIDSLINVDNQRYFGPTAADADETWKVLGISYIPNADLAADGTDFIGLRAYKGAGTGTPITADRNTSSTGFTEGTPDVQTLTGVGSELEIDASNPLHVDTVNAGSGIALDTQIVVEFDRLRPV